MRVIPKRILHQRAGVGVFKKGFEEEVTRVIGGLVVTSPSRKIGIYHPWRLHPQVVQSAMLALMSELMKRRDIYFPVLFTLDKSKDQDTMDERWILSSDQLFFEGPKVGKFDGNAATWRRNFKLSPKGKR